MPYYIVLLFFLGILKKSSENDQLTGHFQSFFIYFFRPPDPKSEQKNSRKSTNKKILALRGIILEINDIKLYELIELPSYV